MKNELNALLEKEMDRREFLRHVGIGLVALTGVSGLLKALNGASTPRRSAGYGASVYGGANRR